MSAAHRSLWWMALVLLPAAILRCGGSEPEVAAGDPPPVIYLSVTSHHDVWAELRGLDTPTSLLTKVSDSSTELFFSTEPEGPTEQDPEIALIGRFESSDGQVELDGRLDLALPAALEVSGLEEPVVTLDGEKRAPGAVPAGSYRLRISGRWR